MSEFWSCKRARDGLMSYCKTCHTNKNRKKMSDLKSIQYLGE